MTEINKEAYKQAEKELLEKRVNEVNRVYFTGVGVIVYALMDPYGKNENGKIRVTPVNYRLDFSSLAVDYKFQNDAK